MAGTPKVDWGAETNERGELVGVWAHEKYRPGAAIDFDFAPAPEPERRRFQS